EISSDLIPLGQADLIIAVEPMESLRYLPWLSADGYLVTNTTPVKNIDDYPELSELLEAVGSVKNHVVIDADNIAQDIGSIRSSNIVMLGAATPYINLKYQNFEDGITGVFGRKGKEITEVNLLALKAGREFSENK
ncbi:MAG: 2-oxoacid:acceptor oxidoreductase family protein, partial [Bacteroidota bacterium]